jgi:putative membrane-bound dehydrogenase-like protein
MTRWLLSLAVGLCLAATACAQKKFDNRQASGQPYLTPAETVAKFQLPPGFRASVFAAEPLLVNPIAMTFDERGRCWVIECFEYPKRTAKGKMPRDRIVILEDTDGDGVADQRTVFAEGKDFPEAFDMASGLEVGHGGVFVGAPPCLWFLQDTNGDGKADKFEKLASGFGSQDTHETLNTFQWGPDGWLYGLHGVFTQSYVAAGDGPPIKMNAAVWRYHPTQKKFEIFAEGTSNPWGMDWRNSDGQFILACCVIPHLYHIVPGGVYQRQAGTSYNQYNYGYLKEISDHNFWKESGHAHAGLISLDVPYFPKEWQNSVIFGSIHGNSLKQNILSPKGSSYVAKRGDDFLVSGDKNFRPINLRWGPDGAIYCNDWHDQNPCHQANADSWDYERGRIYRLAPEKLPTVKAEDLGKKTSADLFDLINDTNPYRYRTAMRLFTERYLRGDEMPKSFGGFWNDDRKHQTARYSWEFLATGGKDYAGIKGLIETVINTGFTEPKNAPGYVPLIRGVTSSKAFSAAHIKLFADRVERITIPEVRRELASAAIRLPVTPESRQLIHALMQHKEDAGDPLIPLLLWLAYEKHVAAGAKAEADAPLEWLKANAPGNALVTQQIVGRTMRRLVATGSAEQLTACVGFVGAVEDLAVRQQALFGITEALGNRTLAAPANWSTVQKQLQASPDGEVQRLTRKLTVAFRDRGELNRALGLASDAGKPEAERCDALRAVASGALPEALPSVLKIVRANGPTAVRAEAVRCLSAFEGNAVAEQLLAGWAEFPPAVRAEAAQVLAGRREWAHALLTALAQKKLARGEITDNVILKVRALKDKSLDALIESAWGRVRATPEALNKLIDDMRKVVSTGPGSLTKGRALFDTHCAKCHQFEGRGHEVGPNLDGAERSIEYLLVNVLDPNRVIGAPYFVRTVRLANGRVETGVLASEDGQSLTLKTEGNALKTISKKDIEEVDIQEKSLMPEGLGYSMTQQDFRDLVRYVMANPFLTDVRINEKSTPISVTGAIPLPQHDKEATATISAKITVKDAFKTRLLLGTNHAVVVSVGEQTLPTVAAVGSTRPDQSSMDVTLPAGTHTLTLRVKYAGAGGVLFARFHDPERKVGYATGE